MSEPSFDVAGRCVLVTGASSGLGRHFATLLAGRGARVALAARRLDRLEKVATGIGAAGGSAFAVTMDVRERDSVRQAVERIETEFAPIDVLVNNSGTTAIGRFLDHSEEDWMTVIDTNLNGPFRVAQEVCRRMVARKAGGSIINVGSILGYRVAAAIPAYVASKGGIARLTEAMAIELARHDIRVNTLAPGYIETDLNRDFFATDAGKALISRVPQRRLGQQADLDGCLLLLASDASRFMTGSTLVADGGHSVSTL